MTSRHSNEFSTFNHNKNVIKSHGNKQNDTVIKNLSLIYSISCTCFREIKVLKKMVRFARPDPIAKTVQDSNFDSNEHNRNGTNGTKKID